MDLEWKAGEQDLKNLQDAFNELGNDALFMSHYELESRTTYTAAEWRRFLTNPAVSDWLNEEHQLLRQTELKKMTRNISQNAKSVGTSQMLAALQKTLDTGSAREGPIFVYGYIPLNPDEEKAPNATKVPSDPFRIKG